MAMDRWEDTLGKYSYGLREAEWEDKRVEKNYKERIKSCRTGDKVEKKEGEKRVSIFSLLMKRKEEIDSSNINNC